MSGELSLGDRMKRYELPADTRLTRNIPAIIRIDGKAFHTWTKGMLHPWDPSLTLCMWQTAYMLCKNIEGIRFAYTQSDEITLLLVDYQTIRSQAWFDYRIQKIVAVSASIATGAFNQAAALLCPSQYEKRGPAFLILGYIPFHLMTLAMHSCGGSRTPLEIQYKCSGKHIFPMLSSKAKNVALSKKCCLKKKE